VDDETRLTIASKPLGESPQRKLTDWHEDMEMFRRARERKKRVEKELAEFEPSDEHIYWDRIYATSKVRRTPMPGKEWIEVIIREDIIGLPGWAVQDSRPEKEKETCLRPGEVVLLEKEYARNVVLQSIEPPFDIWFANRDGTKVAWKFPKEKLVAAIGRLAKETGDTP
jgi:hypothetical protein